VWTRQLAGLVGSGLPLERALTALADEAEDPRQRELLSHLKSEVNAGSSFARALGTRRASSTTSTARWWPPASRAARSGGARAPGRRPGAAPGAARPVLGAMLYPAIVSLIALVIVTFLVTYVVPQVASVFTSSKRALPG
jgi:general secretion pathway protein F